MSGQPETGLEDPPRHPRWGERLAKVYLLLVSATGGYVTYRVLFAPLRSEFVGILMIMAGMPWSTLLGRLVGPHGTPGAALVIACSIGLNALLLYGVGRGVERMAYSGVTGGG